MFSGLWSWTLDSVGERFKIDSEYFIKNGLLAVLNLGVGIVAGILLTSILTRVFTKGQLGEYDLIFSLVSLYALCGLPSLNQLVVQSSVRGNDGSLRQSFRAGVLGLLFGFPLLALGSIYYFQHDQTTVGLGMLVLGLLSLLRYPFRFYEPFLMGKKRFTMLWRYGIASSLLTLVTVVFTAWATQSLLAIVIAFGATALVLDGLFYLRTSCLVVNKKTDPGQIRYGLYLTALSAVPLIAARVDKVLLVAFFSTGELGVYFVATTIPASMQRFFQTLVDVAFPKIASLHNAEQLHVIRSHIAKLVIGTLAVAAILIAAMPYVVPALFTRSFSDAVFFAQLESASFVLFPINLFLVNFLTVQRRTTSQFFVTTLPSITKMVLAVVLIPYLGILAVIGANFAGRVVALVVTLYALLRKHS